MARLHSYGSAGQAQLLWLSGGLLLLLISPLTTPPWTSAQKKVTMLDCITQELPATISPRFQECIEEARPSGTLYRFVSGFECILRLANAIQADRSVNVATLFAAVGDFKGTRFQKAALECEGPVPAIKFTICMLERFQKVCKNRVKIPRLPAKAAGSKSPSESTQSTIATPSRKAKPHKSKPKRRRPRGAQL